MSHIDSPKEVLESYRRRQRTMYGVMIGLVILIIAAGIVILLMALKGPGNPLAPKPTVTVTPTNTSTSTPVPPTLTPTSTATKTVTPTVTNTVTPAGPFEYTVQQDDNCWSIAQQFNVDLNVLLVINNLGNNCPITPGMKILIPTTGIILPSSTPIPADLPKGTRIEYTVQVNDTLEIIAAKFNSTVDAIIAIAENKISNANDIQVGQKLIIPVNLTTPTPTRAATSTIAYTYSLFTNTPVRTMTRTSTKTLTKAP